MEESVIYRSCRQGGIRYAEAVSQDGKPFAWNFQERFYMPAAPIWEQLALCTKFTPADLASVFGRYNGPLYVEIGIGNGEFTAHRAVLEPDSRWLGFEVFHEVFYKAVSRIKRAGLNNVRLMQFDAELFVRMLPEGSVTGFYVNFPDPWPKSRHKKRRLLKLWFMELMRDRLAPGGLITVVTDHDDYAEEISENFARTEDIESTLGAPYLNNLGDYYKTKYYRKFAANSRVYFFNMKKVSK